MPITAQCAGCKKQYRLVDEMAGKKVRCKQCGQTFDVAKSAGTSTKPKPTSSAKLTSTPVARSAAAPAPRRPVPSKPAARPQPPPEADPFAAMAELEEGGIPLQDEAPAVAPPPLLPTRVGASAVSPAPGRGRVIGYARPMRGAPDAAAVAESPAMRYLRLWWLFAIGLALLLFLVSFLIPTMSVFAFLIIGTAGFVLMVWGAAMMLITPFNESAVCGLMYLFVPLYPLYYLLTRWEDMAPHFLRNLGGIAMIAAGVGMMLLRMDR